MKDHVATIDGVLVIADGSGRSEWRRSTPSEWRLERIWPSRLERFHVNRAIHRGHPTLVIENTMCEPVDVLDEEIVAPKRIDKYVVERESGVTTLHVPALDWLPRSIRTEAASLIEEHEQLARATRRRSGPMITPPLASRDNLRVLYLPREDISLLSDEHLKDLAQFAFPHPRKPRKART